MIREILLLHHSHTDIGYTHPQVVVLELQRRFIDRALDIADETADWPEAGRFRWTCEVTGITEDWWARADAGQRDRFLDAIARGQLEVAALGWNLTPLVDHRALLDLLSPIARLRQRGVPVRSAMNCDVNGLPWGVIDALLDHGVDGLSMAINEHFGYAPQPRPSAFSWEGPSGRRLLVYNGLHYGVSPELLLGVPADAARAATAVPAYCAALEARGYPHGFVMMQVTNPLLYDNAAPRSALPDFVRAWNDAGHAVRLRTALLSEVFDALRREGTERLPVVRGDWTDWWNFGAGSTAFETAAALAGQRALRDADQLDAWHADPTPRQRELRAEAARCLALFTEHTWGADRSVQRHHSPETRLQLSEKLVTAARGLSLARMLRRDGLDQLACTASESDLMVLVHNPNPFPVRRSVLLPDRDESVEAMAAPEPHMVHRQDVVFGDLGITDTMPWQVPTLSARWVGPLDVPALGYVSHAYDDLISSTQTGIMASSDSLDNGRMRVEFDAVEGGVRSLGRDGLEYVAQSGCAFGRPVRERPTGGSRQELFGPPRWDPPDRVHELWHAAWRAERASAALVTSEIVEDPGCAAYRQSFVFDAGDTVTVTYRVFPDDPGLELECLIHKVPDTAPHALYLPMPTALETPYRCHFETAGAVVEFDREQLPYSARHYLTTQRFVRIQDEHHGVTVACPDAPLWQVGGFTFGRVARQGVVREAPTLLAWLTNNYWDTNFQADQAGSLRFRFRVLPHAAATLGASLRDALAFAMQPQVHVYRDRGEPARSSARLLDVTGDDVVLVDLAREGDTVRLSLLNPEDGPRSLRIGPGHVRPVTAHRTDLAGGVLAPVPIVGSHLRFDVPPRAWVGLSLDVAA